MSGLIAWAGKFLADLLARVVADWRRDRALEDKGRLKERDDAARQRDERRETAERAADAADNGGDYAQRVRDRANGGD